MASALQNPLYRRRIGLITRAILSKNKSYRTPSTAQAGVQQWLRDRNKPKAKRAKWMQTSHEGNRKKDITDILTRAKNLPPRHGES